MKKIFKSLAEGIVRGLPLGNTGKKLGQYLIEKIRGKETSTTATTPASPDLIAIITEVAMVVLIIFFALKKISNEDLISLLKLLKG